ncbi:outer dynein arm-docking complex subunit 4 [Sitodiplosis mosellana]|uniref:outer dynein arm-docking complex subunit 4 n=1 Tax=Sitodiplosis mosellana TaxID=263140 RepID=UPI0024443B4A|nr:outer dynein arm-docking complex subunit 4 [Sitodiplosis mosellana]XP_055320284.1 outer dynein arm-docking complex subunit 4 [Sitodiplosis mosellana]XP_055320285.1 outer dynein arm-docking complex subunit 4 [Sitodiplosis mosellana]
MGRKKVVKDPQEELEAECKLLIDEATNLMKVHNYTKAMSIYQKALELNPSDQNALVARSKCYLLIGDPIKGLQDAETALTNDKNNIRAIYQKAEALYFLGQFELSLMFFHRGLRLRPELNSFRLGVQKTQEAIEKTIGGFKSSKKQTSSAKSSTKTKRSKSMPTIHEESRPKTSAKTTHKVSLEKREARKLLGELCVDKEYLEGLLKHPDLKRADTGTEEVSSLVNDAVKFLNTRQEFWRQQRPCTALPKKKKIDMKWN